jgi:hypothetical protein
MTDLQAAALQAVLCLAPADGGRRNKEYLPLVLRELATFVSYACDPPPLPPTVAKSARKSGVCLALARAALDHTTRLYTRCGVSYSYTCVGSVLIGLHRYCDVPLVVQDGVAEMLLDVLHAPLTRRLALMLC